MQHTLPVIWSPRLIWSNALLGDSWLDLFIIRVDSRDVLPPSARARAIKGLMRQLKHFRNLPCLWVQVDAPGSWYITALRWEMIDYDPDVVILPLGVELSVVDLSDPLPISRRPGEPDFACLPFDDSALSISDKANLLILRCMARMKHAGVKEIASLAGFGVTYTRKIVARLYKKGLIKPFDFVSDKEQDPTWTIKRPGIQYVYRSWGIPKGLSFNRHRLEQKFAGREHRKITRLFQSRLKKAYGCDLKVWRSWSEPFIYPQNPDTIVWGTYQNIETLIWMEVETGKKQGVEHASMIEYRYHKAKRLAEFLNIRLVFVFLAMPWVLRDVARLATFQLTKETAVIFDHWKDHNHIARPVFNGLNSLSYDNGFKKARNSKKAPKDPSYFEKFEKS